LKFRILRPVTFQFFSFLSVSLPWAGTFFGAEPANQLSVLSSFSSSFLFRVITPHYDSLHTSTRVSLDGFTLRGVNGFRLPAPRSSSRPRALILPLISFLVAVVCLLFRRRLQMILTFTMRNGVFFFWTETRGDIIFLSPFDEGGTKAYLSETSVYPQASSRRGEVPPFSSRSTGASYSPSELTSSREEETQFSYLYS